MQLLDSYRLSSCRPIDQQGILTRQIHYDTIVDLSTTHSLQGLYQTILLLNTNSSLYLSDPTAEL